MSQSGVLPHLLAVVLTVRPTLSGASFIKLADPTGSIGGTIVAEALASHPQLSCGSVVFLRNVSVLRTPPPHSVPHLCITAANIEQCLGPSGAGPDTAQPADGPPLPLPVLLALPVPPRNVQHAASFGGREQAAASRQSVPLLPRQPCQERQQQQPVRTHRAALAAPWYQPTPSSSQLPAVRQQQQQQRTGHQVLFEHENINTSQVFRRMPSHPGLVCSGQPDLAAAASDGGVLGATSDWLQVRNGPSPSWRSRMRRTGHQSWPTSPAHLS